MSWFPIVANAVNTLFSALDQDGGEDPRNKIAAAQDNQEMNATTPQAPPVQPTPSVVPTVQQPTIDPNLIRTSAYQRLRQRRFPTAQV